MSQQKKDESGAAADKPSAELQHLKSLIELMVQNDLSRLELREGDKHILLRRGQPILATTAATGTLPAANVAAPAAAPPSIAPAPAAPAASEAERETLIRSPMVGTFYAATEPEAPPFVSVGTTIGPETVVCLIEAMKVFNEIKAEVAGRVTRVLVQNAQAVEFDQPLFAVAPV